MPGPARSPGRPEPGAEPASSADGVRVGVVLSRGFDLLENTLAYACGALLAFLMVAITYDVVGRNFLGVSAPWTVEVSEYLLLYVTFMAAPWILREHAHVRIEFLLRLLPPLGQVALTLLAMGLVLTVCAYGAWVSYGIVADNFERGIRLTGILTVPRWLTLLPLPVGFTLLALEASRQIVRARQAVSG